MFATPRIFPARSVFLSFRRSVFVPSVPSVPSFFSSSLLSDSSVLLFTSIINSRPTHYILAQLLQPEDAEVLVMTRIVMVFQVIDHAKVSGALSVVGVGLPVVAAGFVHNEDVSLPVVL